MKDRFGMALVGGIFLALLFPSVAAEARSACPRVLRWRALGVGVVYATADTGCAGAAAERIAVSDRRIHIVRIDPGKARLQAVMVSAQGKTGRNRTAAQWAKARRLSVVINLGMYKNDHRTHVGRLRTRGHTNSAAWVSAYQSVLAFQPRAARVSRAVMIDRDAKEAPKILARYDAVVQNLRLIRRVGNVGHSVWGKKARRWSEAALAQDRSGRILFLFSRAPLTMWEFNRLVLALPLGVVRAAHLEGGPEASLSIHARGVNLDLCGSFETGFVTNDGNAAQWPLPNVLGVAR